MADQEFEVPTHRKRRRPSTGFTTEEKNKRMQSICIGDAIDKWKLLKSSYFFSNDKQFAECLLDTFSNYKNFEDSLCSQCQARRLCQEEVLIRTPAEDNPSSYEDNPSSYCYRIIKNELSDEDELSDHETAGDDVPHKKGEFDDSMCKAEDENDLELSVETPAEDSVSLSCSLEADKAYRVTRDSVVQDMYYMTPAGSSMDADKADKTTEDSIVQAKYIVNCVPSKNTDNEESMLSDGLDLELYVETQADDPAALFSNDHEKCTTDNTHKEVSEIKPKHNSDTVEHYSADVGTSDTIHKGLNNTTEIPNTDRVCQTETTTNFLLDHPYSLSEPCIPLKTTHFTKVIDVLPIKQTLPSQKRPSPKKGRKMSLRQKMLKAKNGLPSVHQKVCNRLSQINEKAETSAAMDVEDGEFQLETSFQISKENSASRNVEDNRFKSDCNFQIKKGPLGDWAIYRNVYPSNEPIKDTVMLESDSMCKMTVKKKSKSLKSGEQNEKIESNSSCSFPRVRNEEYSIEETEEESDDWCSDLLSSDEDLDENVSNSSRDSTPEPETVRRSSRACVQVVKKKLKKISRGLRKLDSKIQNINKDTKDRDYNPLSANKNTRKQGFQNTAKREQSSADEKNISDKDMEASNNLEKDGDGNILEKGKSDTKENNTKSKKKKTKSKKPKRHSGFDDEEYKSDVENDGDGNILKEGKTEKKNSENKIKTKKMKTENRKSSKKPRRYRGSESDFEEIKPKKKIEMKISKNMTTKRKKPNRDSRSDGKEYNNDVKEIKPKKKRVRGRPKKIIKPTLATFSPLEDGKLQCTFCKEIFNSDQNEEAHCSTHEPVFVCEKCGQLYPTEIGLLHHYYLKCDTSSNFRAEEYLTCQICLFSCKYQRQYAIHMRDIHNDSSHFISSKKDMIPKKKICELCGEMFQTKSELKTHKVRVHMETRPYLCPECGKQFVENGTLKRHMYTHREKTVVCKESSCEKTFPNVVMMIGHFRNCHQNKDYNCKYENCGRSFRTAAALKKHIRSMIHEKNRTFICDWPKCGKSFLAIWHLRVHKRIHTDENPVQCKFCAYTCRQRAALKWHLRKHGIFNQQEEKEAMKKLENK